MTIDTDSSDECRVQKHGEYVKWERSLKDRKTFVQIASRIDRYRKFGNIGDCKFIRDGVYELRIHIGPGWRVYFTRIEDKILLLLCGGDKSTQSRDIDRAVFLASNLT